MATNVDTSIAGLDPHPSPLSGSEIFPLTQSGQTVNALLSEIKTFITSGIPVGTGDITGTLNANYYPVASGTKTIVNGRMYQDASNVYIDAPGNNSFATFGDAGHQLIFDNGVNLGVITISNTGFAFDHNIAAFFNSPDIYFSQLSANTVPYLDGSKVIRSSAITPTKLSYLGTARSDLQVQIDAVTSGLSWKQEVACATTANITLSGLQTIDTYTVVVGDRVLVKNQSTASQNGIYIVASGAWTRATDCDSTSEMVSATVQVRFGAASPTGNKDTQWSCSNTNQPVIGTDSITFVQINGGATYTNGAGLTLSGNVFSIGAGQVVNSMIANNSIDLTAKVTNVLKQVNGGTGISTNPSISSIPFQNTTTAYGYDQANFNYDSTTKTLNVNNINIEADDSITGLNINAFGVGINVNATDAGKLGILINAKGSALQADSETGIAGRFTSYETAGEFNQQGIITADYDAQGFVVNRNFTRADASTAKATGACFIVNDMTSTSLGTGLGFQYNKDDVEKFGIAITGKSYGNLQNDIKLTHSGSVEYDVTSIASVGSTTTSFFSKTIKANTLDVDGDEYVAHVYFNLNQATTQKLFSVIYGGTTIYNGSAAVLTGSTGSAEIIIRIVRVSSGNVAYSVKVICTDHSLTSPVIEELKNGTLAKTLTSNQTLQITGLTSSGSTDGAITSIYSKCYLNPRSA